jgi:hypothetical protein
MRHRQAATVSKRSLPAPWLRPSDARGIAARVSRFLYDPDAASDELRRRAERLALLAQSACEPAPDGVAYP